MTKKQIKPFSISIHDDILTDLRARINNTRWPENAPGPEWNQGTDVKYLQQLLHYWANEFDWRTQERYLNTFNHVNYCRLKPTSFQILGNKLLFFFFFDAS